MCVCVCVYTHICAIHICIVFEIVMNNVLPVSQYNFKRTVLFLPSLPVRGWGRGVLGGGGGSSSVVFCVFSFFMMPEVSVSSRERIVSSLSHGNEV